VIHVPKMSSSSSIFHFSFYLYHILKEPIPFEIQCKILQFNQPIKLQQNIDCSSSFSFLNNNHIKHYSYIIFRSLSVHVTRQIPLIEQEEKLFPNPSKIKIFKNKNNYFCLFFRFYYLSCYRPLYSVLISCLFCSYIIYYLENKNKY
jgi:hypothetical protein